MIPARLGGNNRLARWLNFLRDELLASRVTSVQGGKLERGPTGTKIIVDTPDAGAKAVYVKCCLSDGSELYLPVLVRGQAYRTNGGTTQVLEVVDGDVPDGCITLEAG